MSGLDIPSETVVQFTTLFIEGKRKLRGKERRLLLCEKHLGLGKIRERRDQISTKRVTDKGPEIPV